MTKPNIRLTQYANGTLWRCSREIAPVTPGGPKRGCVPVGFGGSPSEAFDQWEAQIVLGAQAPEWRA